MGQRLFLSTFGPSIWFKLWQMLPAPNTFEPASNIISKIPKIPFIIEMKIWN